MTNAGFRVALATLVVGGTACEFGGPNEQASEETVDQTQGGITGGNLAQTNTSPFNSVVKLPGCSGSKIGPRRFLTAAHCQNMVSPGRSTSGGTTVTIDNTLGGNTPMTLTVDRFFTHPSYGDPAGMGSDAAVLDVLQDTPSIPAFVVDSTPTPAGTGLTLLGYGCDDRNPSNGGKKQWANRLTMTFAEINALSGPGTAVHDPLYFYYNGGPLNGAYVQVCPGDSGGPSVRSSQGPSGTTWLVAGVNVYRFADMSGTIAMSAATKTAPIAGWLAAPKLGAVHGSITNIITGKCLSGGPAGNAVTMEQCDPTSTAGGTQFWSVVTTSVPGKRQLKNGKSGLCLDGGLTSGTTNLTLASCQSVPRQRWSVSVNAQTPGEIVHEQTGQLLGALGGGTDLSNREINNRQRWLVAP